jgi:hypothetical protein
MTVLTADFKQAVNALRTLFDRIGKNGKKTGVIQHEAGAVKLRFVHQSLGLETFCRGTARKIETQ